MSAYALQHPRPYGRSVNADTGELIATVYRFATTADRDAWLEADDRPAPLPDSAYREAVKASHPLVRRALRHPDDYSIRDYEDEETARNLPEGWACA